LLFSAVFVALTAVHLQTHLSWLINAVIFTPVTGTSGRTVGQNSARAWES